MLTSLLIVMRLDQNEYKSRTLFEPYRCVCEECEPLPARDYGHPALKKAFQAEGDGSLTPTRARLRDLMAQVIPGRKAS
jgi:hypothetical protein